MPEQDTLELLREALRGFQVRVVFGISLSLSAGSVQTARVERREGTRWVRVGPLLLAPDGGGRSDLLRLLADLAEQGKTPQEIGQTT